jgi:hypothetical protein
MVAKPSKREIEGRGWMILGEGRGNARTDKDGWRLFCKSQPTRVEMT